MGCVADVATESAKKINAPAEQSGTYTQWHQWSQKRLVGYYLSVQKNKTIVAVVSTVVDIEQMCKKALPTPATGREVRH